MDKFGLFNLLSALVSPTDSDGHDESAPSADTQNENRSASRGSAAGAPASVPTQGFFSPDERLARAASLLERHDSISRRIDKKNGK